MKAITLIILLITSQIKAQKMNVIEAKEANNLIEYWYLEYSNIFKAKSHLSKTVLDYLAPWEQTVYSTEDAEKWLALLGKNSYVKEVTHFGKKGLKLLSKFEKPLGNINIRDVIVSFELIPQVTQLEFKTNNDLNSSFLTTNNQNNTECHFSAGFYDISPSQFISKDNFVKLNMVLLNEVPFKKVTKNGQIISLGEQRFKIIETVDNMVVILNLEPKSNKSNFLENLNMINLDNQGNKIQSLSPSEILKIKADKPTDSLSYTPYATKTIVEYNYKVFKNNPNLSFNEYQKQILPKLQKVMTSGHKQSTFKNEFGEVYTIFFTPNTIENAYFNTYKYITKALKLPFKTN